VVWLAASPQGSSSPAADALSDAAAAGGEEGEGAAVDKQAAADAEAVVLAFMAALAVPEARRRLGAWVDVAALERLKQAAEAAVAAEAAEPSSHEPRSRTSLARHATGSDRAAGARRARAARAARARARGAAAAAASLSRRQAAAARLARDGAAATLQLLFQTDTAARMLADAATCHGRLPGEVRARVRRDFDPRVSDLAVGRLALRCEVDERRLSSQARLQAAASEVRRGAMVEMVQAGSAPLALKKRTLAALAHEDGLQETREECFQLERLLARMRAGAELRKMRDQRAALARMGAHSATLARDAPLRERIATARARRAILRSQLELLSRATGREEGELGGLRKRNAQTRRSIGKLSHFRDRTQAEPPLSPVGLGPAADPEPSGGPHLSGDGGGGGGSSRMSLPSPRSAGGGSSAWEDDPERLGSLLEKLAAQRAAQRRAVVRRAAQAEEGRARVVEREAAAAEAPPQAEAKAPYISRTALLQSHSPPSVPPPPHKLVAEKQLTARFKIEATTAARHIKP
jgi:hypothetical protein